MEQEVFVQLSDVLIGNKIRNFRDYKVSNHGRILGIKSGRILKPSLKKKGKYHYYVLIDGNTPYPERGVSLQGHRLFAQTFLPNPENKPCVNHIDGNPSNNTIWNLEWSTYKENTRNAMERGMTTGLKEKVMLNYIEYNCKDMILISDLKIHLQRSLKNKQEKFNV